jgi:hypothetical protein
MSAWSELSFPIGIIYGGEIATEDIVTTREKLLSGEF